MITFNEANFRKVLDQIKNHPETWDQGNVHCGSAHCFFGWAQIMAGKPEDKYTARVDGRIWIGLTFDESEWLFDEERTLEEFEWFVASPDNRKGYDPEDFDWNGYDKDGYGRSGYNRDGCNRSGLDEEGYDAGGYDRCGRDRRGFNVHGYDRDGYACNGRNSAGFDRYGYDMDNLDASLSPGPVR